ncbi:MAG TPA: D-2-hydroxyacid dehydrogenase [Candidatus Methylomirabilis sp.]|nr:D-2-hydroxyacid dehydrogenase [Candidatus Methylomirabilis sp.]
MTFKILLLPPDVDDSWLEKIRQAVPGAVVKAFRDPQDARADIEDADAAYGTVPPELFARAKKLRWICAARAGLGGAWFYDALVQSPVVVTNMRGSYNEHLSAHAVAFVLAFARRFEHYLPQKQWKRGPGMIDLPTQTVMIVGVGGAGGETSKLCAALGMRVLGSDPRVTDPPPGMSELCTPDLLDERLAEADFVIVTVPETPATLGMFDARRFARMKRGSYLINISRGGCVVTQDLIGALRSGHLAGAGLDVADPEPLPPDSPLWRMPNVLITPHVAISGAPYRRKWEEILLENCRRFGRNEPLLNVVDKRAWY